MRGEEPICANIHQVLIRVAVLGRYFWKDALSI